MKYIIDVDALKECLDFIGSTKINGNVYVPLEDIKAFIDAFPKTPADYAIPPLTIRDEYDCGTMQMIMNNSKQEDPGNQKD